MQTRSECCGKLAKSLFKPVQITCPCKALGAQCENVGVAGNRKSQNCWIPLEYDISSVVLWSWLSATCPQHATKHVELSAQLHDRPAPRGPQPFHATDVAVTPMAMSKDMPSGGSLPFSKVFVSRMVSKKYGKIPDEKPCRFEAPKSQQLSAEGRIALCGSVFQYIPLRFRCYQMPSRTG